MADGVRPPNLGAMVLATVARFPDRPAVMIPLAKGEFETLTYRQWGDRILRAASAIAALGLQPGDRIVILGENSAEWAMCDWACQLLGLVVVPIYPTLTPADTQFIARDSGARHALCASPEMASKLEGTVPTTLFRNPAIDDGQEPLDEAKFAIPGPDDPASIIYTSGTTGEPKGAVLSHRAFIHVAATAAGHIELSEDDVFLSFLPLSHVYERVAGHCLPMYLGGLVAHNKSLMSLAGELTTVNPSLMMCVPRFLESFRDKALDGIKKAPPIRQKLFALALAQGTRRAQGKFAPLFPITDMLVGKKVRERVGSRFRYFVSGGAALAPAVAEFFMAFRLDVLQGYGLTETAGGTCVNRPGDNRYWTVGPPLDMELRFAEDGEILFRGAGLFSGYWNRPEDTAAAIDADGWFHTGDIGELEGENLKITDRKKDLLVLGNGKNVAPQPIENKLKAQPHIAEAVVLGDGMESCVALIVPKLESLRAELGLPEGAPVSGDERARAILKKEIDAVNKGLNPYELVKKFELLDAPFSQDSGELTPSLKVKRRVVKERYADRIDTMRR